MNKKFTFLAAGALLAAMSTKAQFQPVVLTGFNADIVANGVGPATGSTNATADNGTYGFLSKDFKATATSSLPTYGLPVDGMLTSANTAGVVFQLRNYDSSNVLRLVTGTTTGTLSLVTPRIATDLYLLAYSGSGSSTASVVVNFTDGTTQSATVTVSDWFNGTGYAAMGIGRVSLSGDNAQDGTSSNPRLYEYKISLLAANASKQIASLTITKTNTGGSLLGVMGLVAYVPPVFTQVTVSGFNADVVANGTGAPSTTTSNDVDGATPPFVFIASDYLYSASCSAPTRSLPANGLINSAATSGLSFQLQSYSSNNDLRLAAAGSGTLTFGTSTTASTVYLLGVGGGGAARVNATVTFSDGTTQDFTNVDIADWYGTTTNAAILGIGRVTRTVAACGGTETSTSSPKLYQIPLNISSANANKLITSVTITRVNGNASYPGLANIMAVSVANPNPSLPITLSAFAGYRNKDGNKLEWTTASEQNNAGFEIERSADGRNFSQIAFVASKALNGNSTTAITYSLVDTRNLTAAAYYRLKQVDKDGKATYSRIVFIKGLDTKSFDISALYPNPVKGQLQVQLTTAKAEKLTLVVADAAGKIVLQKTVQVQEGANNLNLNVQQISAGNYYIKAINENGTSGVSKFVKY
jgi:hypothetical protein